MTTERYLFGYNIEMIKFTNPSLEIPFIKLREKYDLAIDKNQRNIEAICITSFSKTSNEVNARYVNLKNIDNKDLIFFSNYNSPKSKEFSEHSQITALIYWNTTNTQIRLKAFIKKTSSKFNKAYFVNRSEQKNALAISSNQSKSIDFFEDVEDNYNKSLKSDNLRECPDYWGGYSFTPYYFEFWEGHKSRLNKRDEYKMQNGCWDHSILQP